MSLNILHRRRLQGLVAEPPPPTGEINTIIGGMGGSITSAQLLADKLVNYSTNAAFSVNDIYNFSVVGNDVQCFIAADYRVNLNYAFAYSCTKYIDSDNHFKQIAGAAVFELAPITYLELNGLVRISGYRPFNQSKLKHLIFPYLTSCFSSAFSDNTVIPDRTVYIPRCTDLGGSVLANDVFTNVSNKSLIYVNPSLQTNNSGSPDGDLQAAVTNGATVSYVANFTAPNAIANLTMGYVYATALQGNFTPPTGSANTIEYYEIWVNGVFNRRIERSGGYALNLAASTAYNVEVKPVDIYYNRSTSNIVAQTTAATDPYPISNINSYYRLETNAKDNVSKKDGTPTAVTYSGGYAVFNGSANISLPANLLINPTEFSASFLVQADNTTSEYRCFSLNNNTGGAYVSVRLNQSGVANRISAFVRDSGDREITTNLYTATNLLHVGLSAIKNGSFSLYINGTLIGTYSGLGDFAQISFNGNYLGTNRAASGAFLRGKMRGAAIWNKSLTSSQWSEAATKQLAGEQLV